MKVFGVFDPDRRRDELRCLLDTLAASMNHGSYRSDVFVDEGLGLGRLYFDFIRGDTQPIWNEDKTRFIVMVGDIFDYENGKRELVERGHEFRYGKSGAEFILHGYEEWGTCLFRALNGVFLSIIYDCGTRTLSILNDRYGMKPFYYFYDDPFLIFASEVKAVIKDDKVGREVDWDGWHDIFSYGYLIGMKTVFRDIKSLPNAIVMTLNEDGISFDKYWRYDQIKVDDGRSEREWVDEGVRLLRQAVERQTRDLKECIVPLSGGIDSRGIACALKKYTDVRFETFTYPACEEDTIYANEIAQHLELKNTFIARPEDLVEKHLVDMVYLNDGMRTLVPLPPTTMMQLHYVREGPETSQVHLMGLGSPIFWGRPNERDVEKHIQDDEKLAVILDRRMRRVKVDRYVDEFFMGPERDKLKPRIKSLLEEISSIGEHENRMVIFLLKNNTTHNMSLYVNNMISVKTNFYLPYLDNDLVEYCFSIPLAIKQNMGIRTKIFNKLFHHQTNDRLQLKIMKKMCPQIMRISSTRYPVFSRYFLSTLARSKIQKKRILLLLFQHLKHYLVKRRPIDQTTLHEELVKKEFKYMVGLLKSLKMPPYIDGERLIEKTQRYLREDKDPSHFLVPLLEFCIWYNLFIEDVSPSELTTN